MPQLNNMRCLVSTGIYMFFLLFSADIKAQNILISADNFPNEPSIALNPKNPAVMVAAANLNSYYVSRDTGHTWTTASLSSSFGVWGDPVIAVDTAGDFYFFHLSNPPFGDWIDRIVCQKTRDNGQTWSDGSFTGLNNARAQDKHWCAVDRTDNHLYLTWTQFDRYGSTDPRDSSTILFSKSTDGGESWSSPKRISHTAGDCIDEDNTVEGAVPAVGPNGEVYVAWAGPRGLVFNKSLDQGETWLPEELEIAEMPGGWDYAIPGIFRANGLPVTACDVSHGPHRGTIYVNWSDQRMGVDNTDVWLVKSVDGGASWSEPIKVNDDDTDRHQFFTWMAVDQTNGYLYFVFYDRRNHEGDSTDVYMALSTDGGNTFINRKISQSPFLPHKDIFFGDYTNLTVHDGVIRPIWTRLNNGELSLWTHIGKASEFTNTTHVLNPAPDPTLSFENYPNPTNDLEYVSFKLHERSTISLYLEDTGGRTVAKLIDHERRDYGKYVERFSTAQYHLPRGLYFLKLEINGKVTINRVVKH